MRWCPASTTCGRAGKAACGGVSPVLPLCCTTAWGSLLSYHRPGAPMAAKGWGQAPSSTGMCLHPSPFPREGVSVPHADAQAPRFPPRTPHGLSRAWRGHTHRSGAGVSSHHAMKGELGPAAFSQIQSCRSSGLAHWAGLMFPRLIMAQDPFDFDCHGLDGEMTREGLPPPCPLPGANAARAADGCLLYAHTGGAERCSQTGDPPVLPY